jgi:hypothetical protein
VHPSGAGRAGKQLATPAPPFFFGKNMDAGLSALTLADVMRRAANQEHPLLTRLVVLRVHLNHEFGSAFSAYDHELAEIERELAAILK